MARARLRSLAARVVVAVLVALALAGGVAIVSLLAFLAVLASPLLAAFALGLLLWRSASQGEEPPPHPAARAALARPRRTALPARAARRRPVTTSPRRAVSRASPAPRG